MNRRQALTGLLISTIAHRVFAQGMTALSGDRFSIGDKEYQLADIIAPPRYTLGDQASDYFEEARAALAGVLAASDAGFETVGAPSRWGVQPVRLFDRNVDAAERLLELGAARVDPQTDDDTVLDRYFSAEERARDNRRGLWARRAYRIRDANNDTDARTALDAFHLLEGEVTDAAKVGGRVYLNFGEDYKTDATITIRSRDWRKWFGREAAPEAFIATPIRMRGYVHWRNGPVIEPTHRRQFEFFDEPPSFK